MNGSGTEVRSYRITPDQSQKRATFVPAAQRAVEASIRLQAIQTLLEDVAGTFGSPMQARARWSDSVGTVQLLFEGTSEELSRITTRATILASEALHHIRTALDYVAYNIAWLDAGVPNQDTQFLLVDTRAEWLKAARGRRLQGVSSEHLVWMEEVQPFRSVAWSRSLRRLSNTDKHRVAVDLRPYYEVRFPMDQAVDDPLGDPEWFGFRVIERKIGLLITDSSRGDAE